MLAQRRSVIEQQELAASAEAKRLAVLGERALAVEREAEALTREREETKETLASGLRDLEKRRAEAESELAAERAANDAHLARERAAVSAREEALAAHEAALGAWKDDFKKKAAAHVQVKVNACRLEKERLGTEKAEIAKLRVELEKAVAAREADARAREQALVDQEEVSYRERERERVLC